MGNCVNDDNAVVAKIEAFDKAITSSEKFKIKGVNVEEDLIVIDDTSKSEGIYGKYIEIPVKEIMKPLDQLMDVLALKRKDKVLDGITRIVGYYSRVDNWNVSKRGELRDRIISRYGSGYGFNGSEVNFKQLDEALGAVNSL